MNPILRRWLVVPALCCAVGCADPEPPPVDPRQALERVIATLDETARLDRDDRGEEARAAWRRAHTQFETELEPVLRTRMADRDVAALEYDFARIRSEIDQAAGRPGPVVTHLTKALRAELDPPTTDGQTDAAEAP